MFTFYNNESLRKLVVGFGTLFNDMYVGKYNDDGDLIEKNRVPLTYGPKEKFIRRIKEVSTISDVTRSRITLPRMGFEMLGMSYDPTRKINKLTKANGNPFNSSQETGFVGVPYLTNFGLYTFTRNIDENLQLVEQILPYFSPEFIIKINFNNLNRCVNVPIVLTSTGISEIYEGDFSETRSITTTFSFIAKTYVYGKISSQNVIENTELRMFSDPEETDDDDSRNIISVTKTLVDDETQEVVINQASEGPFAVDGYYPLYSNSDAAVAASPFPDMIRPGETTVGYHTHILDSVKYYMPNGLVMNRTQFHGNYPDTIPGPDIPTDPGIDIDPDVDIPSIIVAGGHLDFPYKPSLVLNGSKASIFYISQQRMGLTENEEVYKNETDNEFRERVQNYLADGASFTYLSEGTLERWIDKFGEDPTVPRSTYLNENTTGWILLDWERPLNLGSVGTESDEDITWWVQGVIRRINILREFIPNAKIGLWRFGQGRNPRFNDTESIELQLQKQVFASNVEYEGKNLFDAIDFMSPALYHAYEEGSIADTNTRDGTRAQRCIDVMDAIFEEHGETKPVVPIISFQYEGGPYSNQLCYNLNALEINYFKDYASHWAYWFALTTELDSYYYIRDRLINVYEQTYTTPPPIDYGDPLPRPEPPATPIEIDSPVEPTLSLDLTNETDSSDNTRPGIGGNDERSTDDGNDERSTDTSGGYGY